jgi:hypothetical protein
MKDLMMIVAQMNRLLSGMSASNVVGRCHRQMNRSLASSASLGHPELVDKYEKKFGSCQSSVAPQGEIPQQLCGQIAPPVARLQRVATNLATCTALATAVLSSPTGILTGRTNLAQKIAESTAEQALLHANIGQVAQWAVGQTCGLVSLAIKGALLPLAWITKLVDHCLRSA